MVNKLLRIAIISSLIVAWLFTGWPLDQVRAQDWYDSSWQYRRKITIDNTKVDASLTDFPVAIFLTSANFDFTKALPNGHDIRFTNLDGTVEYAYGRERHDATDLKAEYHVKVPSVSETVDTEFWMYYGNPDAPDGADPTNVWGANTLAVWHMPDAPGNTLKDSTANDNTVNKRSATQPSEVEGQIAKAQSFNADWAWDWSKPNLDDINNSTGFTISAWYKPDGSNPSFHYILIKNTAALTDIQYGMYIRTPNAGGVMGAAINGVTVDITGSSRVWTNGVWHHVVLTWDGSTLRGYVNGSQVGSDTSHTTTMTPLGDKINLGRRSNSADGTLSSGAFGGTLDEIRLEKTARSTAWIKAEYNSGNGTLLSVGGEEVLAPPAAPVLYSWDGVNQIAFNNIRQNSTTPIFRVSATHDDDFDTFEIELNTQPDFEGTSYTETFPGNYSSGTQYNLETTGALGLPTIDGVTYYVRVRASADGGTNWSDWSTENQPIWSYTYSTAAEEPQWHQTTDAQFETGTLDGTEASGSGSVQLGVGVGGFPQVASVTETAFGTDTTNHYVNMPATVNAGDLLIVLFTNDGSATVTTPAGWTSLASTANGIEVRCSVYYKIAAGTEGGTTVNFVASAFEQAAAQVYRITDWHGTTPPEISTAATGTSNRPNPASLDPAGWDVADTLWIAVAGQDRGDQDGPTAYPAYYTDGISTLSAEDDTSTCRTHSARRVLAAASENPGAFTIPLSEEWVAFTIAVRPAPRDLTTSSTAGGSVTTPGEGVFTYDEGTVVDLAAEADACYEFINWTGDVDLSLIHI